MNCPKCYAVLQLADKSRPACSCGWNMDDRDEELSDEKPAPFTVPPPDYGMPGMSERINKLMRSLMRHRERYIRAWIAHYGARPEQVSLVESWMDAGRYGDLPVQARTFSVRFVKDTDDVAELVKAAREVLDDKGSGWLASDTILALEAALERFEG